MIVEGTLDRAYRKLIREGSDIASLEEYSASLRKIPFHYIRYRVELGDTLKVIARRHNTLVSMLAEANGITSRTSLRPGQLLLVPQQ
ncbi:MAG: LysM peptidoglycan-binding domain-containing protein [Anaerolineae bacterium]